MRMKDLSEKVNDFRCNENDPQKYGKKWIRYHLIYENHFDTGSFLKDFLFKNDGLNIQNFGLLHKYKQTDPQNKSSNSDLLMLSKRMDALDLTIQYSGLNQFFLI